MAPAPGRAAPVPRVARALVRCDLPTDLVTTCGGLEIAVDRGGLVYLSDGQSVRRLRADVASGCALRLEPAGELALAREPRAASGFAAAEVNWHLVDRDGVPHGLDFTNGLMRLDGATPQPVCGELAGVRRLAFVDAARAVTDRADQRLLDLRTCRLVAQKLTPAPLDIAGADGVLFGIAGGQVHRYASVTAAGTPIEEPPTDGRVPSAIVPCGQGVCVLDANTAAIERYARRGELVEVATYARDDHPMEGFAAAPDGSYWLVRRGPLPMPAGDTSFTYTNKLTCPIEVYRLGP